MTEFTPFPKIPRLNRDCVITEKIDGTNAAVVVSVGDVLDCDPEILGGARAGSDWLTVRAQSRKRFLTLDSDNFGFAAWVGNNAPELALALGVGTHFGEWWGQGIQRGYGLDEKRFSLFNTTKWADDAVRPECCHVVPTLYAGPFSTATVNEVLFEMYLGSLAAPGYDRPEGLIIFHKASGHLYKVLLEGDEIPKGLQ